MEILHFNMQGHGFLYNCVYSIEYYAMKKFLWTIKYIFVFYVVLACFVDLFEDGCKEMEAFCLQFLL